MHYMRDLFGIYGFPRSVLIDENGTVISDALGLCGFEYKMYELGLTEELSNMVCY